MTALAKAESQTARNPSLPQIAAGNYKKGKYRIHGLVVSIENPRGSIRSARDGSWKVRMPAAYGYILGTEGADSQQLDVFLGPHCRSPLVYVIDQKDAKTGRWDEHKCFFGFSTSRQVKRIYEAAFSDGRAKDRLGALHEMTVTQFRDWLEHGKATLGRIGGDSFEHHSVACQLWPPGRLRVTGCGERRWRLSFSRKIASSRLAGVISAKPVY